MPRTPAGEGQTCPRLQGRGRGRRRAKRQTCLHAVRRRQRPCQIEVHNIPRDKPPPVAHASNTGGARRSAWKSVMPTSSSQVTQATASAVVESLPPRSRFKPDQPRCAEQLLRLALSHVSAHAGRATHPAGRQRPQVQRIRARVKAARPGRHPRGIPPLPVGKQLRPLRRRGDLPSNWTSVAWVSNRSSRSFWRFSALASARRASFGVATFAPWSSPRLPPK